MVPKRDTGEGATAPMGQTDAGPAGAEQRFASGKHTLTFTRKGPGERMDRDSSSPCEATGHLPLLLLPPGWEGAMARALRPVGGPHRSRSLPGPSLPSTTAGAGQGHYEQAPEIILKSHTPARPSVHPSVRRLNCHPGGPAAPAEPARRGGAGRSPRMSWALASSFTRARLTMLRAWRA